MLSVAYLIGDARKSGKSWVVKSQCERYVEALKGELEQMSPAIDASSVVTVDTGSALPGWRFVRWRLSGAFQARPMDVSGEADTIPQIDAQSLEALVRDKYPRGEIWAMTSTGDFVFGQLALKRLWLPSRAILTAQVIVAWADRYST